MAATTGVNNQADAQTRLQLWLDAEEAVSKGQAHSIGDRSLTRANLSEITERIAYWQRQVLAFQSKALGAGSPMVKVVRWTG